MLSFVPHILSVALFLKFFTESAALKLQFLPLAYSFISLFLQEKKVPMLAQKKTLHLQAQQCLELKVVAENTWTLKTCLFKV